MEHNEVEFKMKSTSWQDCNLWENNAVEFFDPTSDMSAEYEVRNSGAKSRARG
jgi:hypothetical protein